VQRPEQERLVEEGITLKKENNATKSENLKLRTKVLQLEREIARRDEELAELRSKAGEKHYYVALQQAHIVAGLKQTVKELRAELKLRSEAEESLKRSLKFTQIAELVEEIALYEDECIRLKDLISSPREPSSLDQAQRQFIAQLTSDKSALEQRVQALQEKVTRLEMRLKGADTGGNAPEDSKSQELATQHAYRVASLEGELALVRKEREVAVRECEKQRGVAREVETQLRALQGKEAETALQFLVNKLASKDISFQDVLTGCGEEETVTSLQNRIEALRVTVPLRYWEALQARYSAQGRLDLVLLRSDVGKVRPKVRDSALAFFRLEPNSQPRSKPSEISSKIDESRTVEESQDGEYEDDYDPATEERPYPSSDERPDAKSDPANLAKPSEAAIETVEEPSSGPSQPSDADSKRHNSSQVQFSAAEESSYRERIENDTSEPVYQETEGSRDVPAGPPFVEIPDTAPDGDSVIDRGSVYFPAIQGRIKADFSEEAAPAESLFPRPPTPVFPHSPTPDPTQSSPTDLQFHPLLSPSEACPAPSPEPTQSFFPPTPEPEATFAPPAFQLISKEPEISNSQYSEEHSERYFESIPQAEPQADMPLHESVPTSTNTPKPISTPEDHKSVPEISPERPRPGRLPPLALPQTSDPPKEEALSPILSARPQPQQEVLPSHSHPFLPPADSESNSSLFDDPKEVDIDTVCKEIQENMKGSRTPAGVLQAHLEEMTSEKGPEEALFALASCLQEPPFLLEPAMSELLADWLWTQTRGQSWQIPDLLGQQIGGWEQYEGSVEPQSEDFTAKTKANVQNIAQTLLEADVSVREAFDCEGEILGQADFLYGLRALGLNDLPREEFQLLVLSLASSEQGDIQVEDLERLFALYGVPIRPKAPLILSHSPTPVPVDDLDTSLSQPACSFPIASSHPLSFLPPTLLVSEPSLPHFPRPPESSRSQESGFLSPLSESARVGSAKSGVSVVEQGSGVLSPVSQIQAEEVITDTAGMEESGASEYEYMGERVSSPPLGNSA